MLYLADDEGVQGDPVAVSAQLHDPQHDAHGATLAHEEGDAELDYYRMALHQQGLSVTAGAGQVDSERVPLDAPAMRGPDAQPPPPINVFSPSLARAEFDQRAAAEEVERVRRYLAQRRADRAKAQAAAPLLPEAVAPAVPDLPDHTPVESPVAAMSAAALDLDLDLPLEPTVPTLPVTRAAPVASVAWDDLVLDAQAELSQAPANAYPSAPAPELHEQGIDMLEHTDLSESASLLAAFSDSELAPYADAPPPVAVVEVPRTPAPAAEQEVLLGWDMPEVPTPAAMAPAPAVTSMSDAAPVEHEPALPTADVQMQLAIEFRDLGLWAEARERVLEILEQPDTGMHARARTMLEELAQTAPAPLALPPEIKDPWG